MLAHFKRCEQEAELARICLFILDHKRDLHPSYTTMDMVELLYSYATDGHFLYITDVSGTIIGATAYYQGTPELEFRDKNIAFVDIAIIAHNHRGTRLFVKGLYFLAAQVRKRHPEVEEIRLVALAENHYNCRLYAKFAELRYERDGVIGREKVFSVEIHSLLSSYNGFNHV